MGEEFRSMALSPTPAAGLSVAPPRGSVTMAMDSAWALSGHDPSGEELAVGFNN